jgi:hypothetical protein
MTTTITVRTHDWPVYVSAFPCDSNRKPLEDGQYSHIATVPANSEQEFIVYREQDLLFQEMPSEAETADAEAAAPASAPASD